MRLINADAFKAEGRKLYREAGWDLREVHYSQLDTECNIDMMPTIEAVPTRRGARLIDADKLVELIDDDITALDKNMPREGRDVCLCTLRMIKQYIEALPTVPLDWKSIMDDWTEHDSAMIAKGREIERRLNAPKHGRWIEDKYGFLVCSECGNTAEYLPILGQIETPYCSECGARMDLGEVENG